MQTFLVLLVLLILLDFPYLSLIASKYVQPLGTRTYVGCFIAYLLLALGIQQFALGDPKKAAILGLVIYGVFDSVNMAMIPGYPLDLATVDVVWGSLLLSVVTYLTSTIQRPSLL